MFSVKLSECNKMKVDQNKTQQRLLGEINIATDYEYLSRLNQRERVPREHMRCWVMQHNGTYHNIKDTTVS